MKTIGQERQRRGTASTQETERMEGQGQLAKIRWEEINLNAIGHPNKKWRSYNNNSPTGSEWRKPRHEEMETRERYHVHSQLAQISIKLTRES